MTGSAIGLNPPEIVREATEAYLGEEDAIARWVEDCCVTGRDQWCASAELWPSWQRWATAANEGVSSRKRFGMALEKHGYEPERINGIRGFSGLGLKASEKPNPYSQGGSYADRHG